VPFTTKSPSVLAAHSQARSRCDGRTGPIQRALTSAH
jgi:hypothetical protein